MAGERLLAFSVELSEYVLGQFREPLQQLPRRPRRRCRLRLDELDRFDLPAWVGWAVAGLPADLADHVWAGVREVVQVEGEELVVREAERRILTDNELWSLAWAATDPPQRLARRIVWEAYPQLHRRAVRCVTEIRDALTRENAEEWTADSAGCAARLSIDALPLADGVQVVREWVLAANRLLLAMGATSPPHPTLPPESGPPAAATPHTDEPPSAPGVQSDNPADHEPVANDPRFPDYLAALRDAIRTVRHGVNAKSEVVIDKAGVRNSVGLLVLRWLEAQGEYAGFSKKKSARHRRRTT
jgi:hypothetical protein